MLLPSMMALEPAGSSKLHPTSEAPSRFEQSIFTPRSCAPSSLALLRSALSRQHHERLAPARLHPFRLAYLQKENC